MEFKAAKKAKAGIWGIIFGRTGIILLLLLIQIGIVVGGLFYLRAYMFFISAGLSVISVIAVIYVINEPGNPAFKLTWILCIFVVPVVGTVLYFYTKAELGTRYIGSRLSTLKLETQKYLVQRSDVIQDLRREEPENAKIAHYMYYQLGFPIYKNTQVTFFPLGEDKYEELMKQLERAERFIFMEYFIVEEGYMWKNILAVLKEKVAQGVEVRFMYDGTCSVSMLPYNYTKKLNRMGIKAKVFNQIRPMLSTVQNNRDHRKICVIDGKVGFTGGVNLGDEYINRKERFGHWKDTAVMLRGEAVMSLTMLFLQMWNVDVSEKKPEEYQKYLTPKVRSANPSLGYVLPYGDSPFDHENVGEEIYFHILNHAQKYVHIMTPYLILDNEMLSALERAAKSGIEVIIIMPHIPDKAYAFALAKTYYEELIRSGVQIYEYTPGFVHAKIFVSDDNTATVGTINLDYRSLYLHFECGTLIYDNPVVEDIEEDFQRTLEKCEKISLVQVKRRPFMQKATGEVLRLIAPLM